MSLADTIAGAVATINAAVDGLECDVTFKAWTGQNLYGEATYASPVSLRALVIQDVKQVYDKQAGKLVTVKAYVGFLFPVPPTTPVSPATRVNPIDPSDVITLPDGTTGPVILGSGMLNGSTGTPYLSEIHLGV